MFTGIIKYTSNILDSSKKGEILELTIEKPKELVLKNGDSISVNGVCLTVVSFDENLFKVELMQETLDKTIFGGKTIPKKVNLEPSLSVGDKMDGHFVQGHVDTTGIITKIQENKVTIKFNYKFRNLVVEKGSISLNGVSLTVFDVKENSFRVALIPYTLENTTFGELKEKDAVNIEFDILGKYLAKQI